MTTSKDTGTSNNDRRHPRLDKLSVRRYRGIQNLTIERLAHVTLIAGTNGVGKTRLLEAVAKLWKASPSLAGNGANAQPQGKTGPITWIDESALDPNTRTKWWDHTKLSGHQHHVVESVRKIAANVTGMTLTSPDADRRLMPVAMTTTHDNPVPLKTLGSGAIRFFEISLALENTRDGLLLIETPDVGVHYTGLAALWAMILEGTTRNNVQVIATTHNTDSIYALGEATRKLDNDAAAYLRLEQRNDNVRAVEYTMAEIRIANEQKIAVA